MNLKRIPKYFPELSQNKLEQYNALLQLYLEWNQKVNLISRKDIEHLETRHLLHALAIAKFIQFKPKTKILDFGTGGGLPGIPLAIFFPEVQFHLVDSIAKKINVVQDIASKLQLKNVKAEQVRVENIKGQYDFITGRAVKNLPQVLQWLNGKISSKDQNAIPNGLIYLKGGDIDEAAKKRNAEIHFLNDWFKDDFFETKYLLYLNEI
ncbi:MAG: 16S rRNA (guanine(527)-N(7))-methyltransferase RsmG [Flavobacteriales bacterium]|nr:16S rRNA (guanine(527)-N(7))-methyltransferase RsmG [Flavobacteriales bacterium]